MLTFQEVWDTVVEDPDFIVEALEPRVAQLLQDKKKTVGFQRENLAIFLREQVEDLIRGISTPISRPEKRLPPGKAGPKGTMWIDAKSYPIRRYKDILITIVEWLIESGHLSSAVAPIQLGPTRFLLNTNRSHPEGKLMRSPKKLSNGLYLETNASSYACERWARKIMGACGIDDTRLRVERIE